MDAEIKSLPLILGQEEGARCIRHSPGQHGGIEDTPCDDTVECEAPFEAFSGLELSALNATATLEHFMPDLNPPASAIPLETLQGIRIVQDRNSGQQ